MRQVYDITSHSVLFHHNMICQAKKLWGQKLKKKKNKDRGTNLQYITDCEILYHRKLSKSKYNSVQKD